MDTKEIMKQFCSVAMASSFLATCGASDSPKPPVRRMEASAPDWAHYISINESFKRNSNFSLAGHPISLHSSQGIQNIGYGLRAEYHSRSLYIQDQNSVMCRWKYGSFQECSTENPAYTEFYKDKRRPYLVNWNEPLAPQR